MNIVSKTSRVLGIAFLLQFVTSFTSSAILKQAWFVPGNIGETLLKIANSPWTIRMTILLDMGTALGVTFLGVILFSTLKKQNEKIALTALGFYILEAALLAVSRTEAFSLLRISQEYATATNPVLLTMGQVAYESMDYVGNTLHMLAFCMGGFLFYFLFKNCSACSISLGPYHDSPVADWNNNSDIWLYHPVFLLPSLRSL